jgi:xanthine dehydrogenase accessory factor
MTDLYRNLMSRLTDGKQVSLVSVYSSSGIEKTLYTTGMPSEEKQLDTLLNSSAVVDCGPLSFIETDDSFTLIENYAPRPRMIILGGGHIALALVKLAHLTGFSPLVFDDRPMYANPERFPEADEVIMDDFSHVSERVKVGPSDYVVIVTRGHSHDIDCLESILKETEPAYTGMIGSGRRVKIVLDQLEKDGYARERLDRVHTPIGLNIGAVTPEEISVAILAEIIEIRRGGFNGQRAHGGSNIPDGCDTETVTWLAAHEDEDSADAILTILDTHGSVPRETGAKMAMTYDGRAVGTIGGGCAESGVMHEARTVIREKTWKIVEVDMRDTAEEDGMVCGGHMRVLIESFTSS